MLESHNNTPRQRLKRPTVIDTCAYRNMHFTMTLTAAHRLGLNETSERWSGSSSDASGSAARPMQLVEWVSERDLMPQVNHVCMPSWFYA